MRPHPRSPARRLVAILVALLTTLAVLPAHSAWQPGGVRISPPLTTRQFVSTVGLISDGNQGAIASWVFNEPHPYDPGFLISRLIVQRTTREGEIPAPWPSTGVFISDWTNEHQTMPFPLLTDGAGGAISPELVLEYVPVENNDARLLNFYRIAANGTVTWTLGYGAPPGSFYAGGPRVRGAAVDADGTGGVIYMADQRAFSPQNQLPGAPPYSAVYAARVNPEASSSAELHPWPVFPVFTHTESMVGANDLDWFEVLSDGAGGGFFAWGQIGSSGLPALHVQHLDANGAIAPGWPPEGRIVRDLAGSFDGARLTSNGAGGVFVVWRDHRNAQDDLYAHGVLVDGSLSPGTPANGRALVSPQSIDELQVLESDEQGGVFIVRASADNGTYHEVRLFRLDAALLPREGWPSDGMRLIEAGWPDVVLAADGQGGAFVAYQPFVISNGIAHGAGLFCQHLAGDGLPAPGWTTEGYLLSATGVGPHIVRSGNGAIVAWAEYDSDRPGEGGIYAQRLVPDGPVAVQLSLVGATAEPGNVSLHWYATGTAMLAATVERRSENGEWTALGAVSADGAGHLRYEDGSVAGGRFGYRVTWSEDGTERHAGEVWVEVPDAWRLALSAPRPNPGSGPASFAVTLADRTPANLELVDLQGRRVAQRDLGALGAGRHAITIDEAATLAPGVYLARLTQGGATRTTRLIRIR